MRLRLLALALMFSISFSAFASTNEDEPKVFKYWVQLKDKEGTPYSVDKPLEFLSQKAVDRRKKNNIAIVEQDFPVNPAYLKQIKAIPGVTVLNTSRWFNAVVVSVEDDNTVIKFDKLPFVLHTKLLSITKKGKIPYGAKGGDAQEVRQPPPLNTPGSGENDEEPYDGSPEKFYGKGETQIKMLNGIKLHGAGLTGFGVTIAVLDGGFRQVDQLEAFKAAFAAKQILATWDFVMGNEWVYEDSRHGTSVLSCMLARVDGTMVGTAPDASFYLLRTEEEATEFPIEEANWVSAAEYADSAGVDLINSSLGYSEYDDTLFSYVYDDMNGKTPIISRAATIAASKGIIVCNSAGNSGNKKWKYISAPGDADNIITVGAVNDKEQRAYFSSYGPTADGRFKPTYAAMGEATIVANTKNKFNPSNGTSFSTPVLCGMVACLIQGHPKAPAADIMNAIEQSCDGYPIPNNSIGYGIPDFYLAHTILGGAEGFDYENNQLVEFYRHPSNVNNLMYHIYSVTDQELKMIISKRKTVEYESSVKVGAKSFTKAAIDLSKVLEKRGNYTFTLTNAKGDIIAEKEFNY